MSKFLKVIVNLFLVAAILVAGALLVPPLMGISTTMVDSSSMDTNLPIGSVTYSQDVRVADISVGDKILVESDTMAYAYIVESADAGTGNYIVTDANNPQSESEEIALRNVALKIVLTLPLIGYVMIAMRSMEGIIIIGLVVLFMIILFILSELWKKTDEEDEEDEDEEDEEEEDEEDDSEEVRIAAPKRRDRDEEDAGDREQTYAEPAAALTNDELARAVAELKKEEAVQFIKEEPVQKMEETEETEETVSEEPAVDDGNSFVPVVRPSKEDILKKAKAAGEEPEVVEHENIGVTIIDYSDCI